MDAPIKYTYMIMHKPGLTKFALSETFYKVYLGSCRCTAFIVRRPTKQLIAAICVNEALFA